MYLLGNYNKTSVCSSVVIELCLHLSFETESVNAFCFIKTFPFSLSYHIYIGHTISYVRWLYLAQFSHESYVNNGSNLRHSGS